MSGWFDLQNSVMAAVADVAGGTTQFEWGVTALFIVGVIAGLWLPAYVGYKASKDADGQSWGRYQFLITLANLLETLFPVLLFLILTGTFVAAFPLIILAAFGLSLVYDVIAMTLLGVHDQEKQQKIRVMGFAHANISAGLLTILITGLNIIALLVSFYLALMTSFRTDLEPSEIEARLSILLFAVPAVLGFLLVLPQNLAILLNAYLDSETRSAVLARMLPRSLYMAVMLAMPAILYGDQAQAYIPFLPTTGDLVWLPLTVFAVFGLLPYLYSSANHVSQVHNRQRWQRNWLSDFATAFGTPVRMERQREALENELTRMVRRSPYFENYLFVQIRDRFSETDEDRANELIGAFDMRERAADAVQIQTIEANKADLPNWDPLTAYIDELFDYYCTVLDEEVTPAKVKQWQEALHPKPSAGIAAYVLPILGMMVSAVAGPILERLVVPFVDTLFGGGAG